MNIRTENWQIDLKNSGKIVLDKDDVRQCISLILKTRKGEVPLNPHFGSNLWDWIDKPINTAIPNMKKEIIEAVKLFEPRIKILTIKHELVNDKITFNIKYKSDVGELDNFKFDVLENENNKESIKLFSSFILKNTYETESIRYNLKLELDGKPKHPTPPSGGFSNITEMLKWANSNYHTYGKWEHLASQNTIILYVNNNLASRGSLKIINYKHVLTEKLPINNEGKAFKIILKDNNERISPFDDENIKTWSEILNYMQKNHSRLGNWSIDNGLLILIGNVDLKTINLKIEI